MAVQYESQQPPSSPRTRAHPILCAMRVIAALLAVAMCVIALIDAAPSMAIINTDGRTVDLDPTVQHIPLDKSRAHLRPPPARVPTTFDIFVGLSVFRDGYRCAYTVFTGFLRATHPERLHFGVVDQVNPGDARCIDEFCKLAKKQWPDKGACPYRDQIRIDERLADDSRGPTLARHYQQKLLHDEEFCLQLDGHSVFTNKWDENIVADWRSINNEMAVLSTYLHHLHDFIKPNGDNNPPGSLPHLCTTIRGHNGLVRNEGASMIRRSKTPQLSALWGAGLSFSKCHAERRVLIDSHTLWLFDGEEFLRSSHLWTHGYDIYSPSKLGSVVYHNYTKVPARFEQVRVDPGQKALEVERGRNRFKLIVGKPFVGEVDTREMDKFAFGSVRPFADYLAFAGVTFEEGKNDTDTCLQLHWVPYKNATEVEKIVGGGWKLDPQGGGGVVSPPNAAVRHEPEDPVEQQHVENHAEPGAGVDRDAAPGDPLHPTVKEEGLPAPKADATGSAGVIFYVLLFGGVIFVVMANEGVGWRLSNLWRSPRGGDTRKL